MTPMSISRYKLANHLRAAAAQYESCQKTTPSVHASIREEFARLKNFCIMRAEELENDDIKDDVIRLTD